MKVKNKVLKFHHFWLHARTQIEKSGIFYFILNLATKKGKKKNPTHFLCHLFYHISQKLYLSFNKLSIHSFYLFIYLFFSFLGGGYLCVLKLLINYNYHKMFVIVLLTNSFSLELY